MARSRRPLRWLAALVLLASCDSGGSQLVYIPAPGFQRVLTVRADLPEGRTVRTGEWVTLHANRLLGPWQRVPRNQVPDSVPCSLRAEPAATEIDIATILRWEVEPSGNLKFNRPEAPDYERQVQFTRPGRYRLWAVSDRPCRELTFASDTLVIEVR